jgi:GT2 family glycosyltransferase
MSAKGPQPEIAVVIPTYRRETRLRFALEALAEQTIDRDRFETLVVRPEGEAPPLASAPDGLPARFLTSQAIGPGPQRNRGWRESRAPLIAFTDDDCRPAPNWLERILEAASSPDLILQGRTEPDPDELHLLHSLARSQEITGPSEWYPSCNIVYPRELLERAGGFDECFRPPHWGEDTDLGLRAVAGGAHLRYVDDALVRHAVLSRTLHRAIADATRRRWLPLVIARHPEQRRALYLGRFANRGHAALALSVVAALAGRRRRSTLALAAVPYLAHTLDVHLARAPATPRSLARLAVHLPAAVAVDVAELVSTVRGALRHRTFVL